MVTSKIYFFLDASERIGNFCWNKRLLAYYVQKHDFSNLRNMSKNNLCGSVLIFNKFIARYPDVINMTLFRGVFRGGGRAAPLATP